VGCYVFVGVRTHDGKTARVLNLIDEHTREALMVRTPLVGRKGLALLQPKRK